MNPKVFVSHASEDKDRFVTKFATRLRENGIDAWLDKWEMLPGDSLIDKIFEEGLKEADAVIIVLSNYSVDKPWVREELNASIVSKLSKGTKIIPIVLDNCTVPEALKATLWESIDNVGSYDNSFNRILSSILGVTDKPALGALPSFTSSYYSEIGGLAKIDNLVLKEACDFLINKDDGYTHFNPDEVFGDESKLGFSKNEIEDSIEILDEHTYFNVTRYIGGGSTSYNCGISVTSYGFNKYAEAYIENYNTIIENVVSAIVNENITNSTDIISKLGVPSVTINHILKVLESNGSIKMSEYLGGGIGIHHVSASLRRMLTN